MPAPTSRNRYKQLLERKRQARRRQVIRRVAALLLLLVVVALVTAAVASIRGCAARRSAMAARVPRAIPPDPAQSKIELVFAHDFRPGPTFVAVDSQRIYIGQPTVTKDKAPATQLAAFAFSSNEPLWQAPAESALLQLGVSSGNIIGIPEVGESIQRYEGSTGKHLAAIEADAQSAQVHMDGRTVVVGYIAPKPSGGLAARLAAYDPATGARAWTLRPKLAGLTQGIDACCGAQPRIDVSCWDALCAYRLHNVLGLVEPKSGKLLRKEYAAGGHIAAVQVDRSKAGKAAYIVSGDANDPALYRLVRIPLDEALPAKRVFEFRSSGSEFLVLGDAGNVLLAYTDEEGKAQLACFRKDNAGPVLTLDADAGVTDMCAIPSASGEFLVATCSKFRDGEPVGRSRILRVRLGVPDYVETAHYGKPVLWVVPFKHDCLALLRGGGLLGGGQILRYNADSGKLKRLRRAKYELLEPQHSADRKTLLVTSYPASYLLGKGGALQALVFK